MKTPLRNIRILSDGRPGHENQSAGLAEALRRRTGAQVELVRFAPTDGRWRRIERARRIDDGGGAPELLIGAGHGTHLPLVFAAWALKARSVVIMKPSLPTLFFDLCLVPRHDLREPRDAGRMVVTRGALNRIPEEPVAKRETGVIMIGGPSGHHAWKAEPVLAAIAEVVRARPGLKWTLGDSRRTPAGFLDAVAALTLPLEIVPHERTKPGWLPAQLLPAREVWVTEDSTSMVFEALTAGARVGLLPLPLRGARTRVVRAMDDLVADGFVRRFAAWREQGGELPAATVLHETARCAEVVLTRFFKAARKS